MIQDLGTSGTDQIYLFTIAENLKLNCFTPYWDAHILRLLEFLVCLKFAQNSLYKCISPVLG